MTPANSTKRARTRLVALGALVAAVAAVAIAAASARDPERPRSNVAPATTADRAAGREEPVWPVEGARARARDIARQRGGLVSFAAIGPAGRTLGYEEDRRYVSASVVKAMLLVAELRRLRREDLPLDEVTANLLRAMITYSDNEAADAIYYRVGDAGLHEVAARAGMDRFEISGYWANAQLTAADMARFMWRLEELLDLPGGDVGSAALAGIVESQRWGLPEALPRDARIRFKGGWRSTELGQLVHQAGLVEVKGRRYALAVMTDAQPSMEHATGTIRLIGEQLLRSDRRRGRAGSGS